MANVLFKKGLLKNLPSDKVEGTIYVTTDERAMYLDVDASTRIRLGDFNEIPNLNALPDVSHTGGSPNPTGLYYSVAENVLARYDSKNKKWAQINPDNWFEIKSFAQTLSSSTTADNVTTITASTTLIQKDETGGQAASGSGASQWSTNLKFKDDGRVVTITQEGNDTIKISAKDEHVTSAANHYKYDSSRDGSNDLTPTKDATTGNTFITGVTVDDAGHVVGVKSREAVIDLVRKAELTTGTATPTGSGNTAASINLEVDHGDANLTSNIKVEGSGATTVAFSEKGKTLNISSTDQTVEYGHHYNPSTHESASDKITVSGSKVISALKRDNAGHVIGIEERNENTLSGVSVTSRGSKNNVSVTTEVTDTQGTTKNKSIAFKGVGDISITSTDEGKSVTIETHDQHVTSADNHYKALKEGSTSEKIKAGTYNASEISNTTVTTKLAETPVVTGVTIDGAGHVTGIKAVKIADTHNKLTGTGTFTAKKDDSGNNTNGWRLTLTDTDGNENFTDLDPTINYGKGSNNKPSKTAHGLGGSFTLDTYTTGEVDAKITTAIQATGAMVLKDELTSTKKLPTTNVAAGDTYIVTENGITVAGNVCEVGDLFVAKEDKASGSTDANWFYVPSGNDRHILIGAEGSGTVGAVLVDGNQTTNVKYGSINFNSEASASPSLIKATKSIGGPSGDIGAQEVNFTFSMEWGSF